MAQAEMPRLQKISSDGKPRRLAVAPVAMMMLWARNVSSAVLIVNGRDDVSTETTSSVSS